MNGYRKELLSPGGEPYVATSPVEANNLIYGSGYREAAEPSNDEPSSDEPKPVDGNADPTPVGDEVPA